jgi:hypothetical protein
MSSHPDKKEISIEYASEEEKIGLYADVTRMGISSNTFSFEFAQSIPPEASGQKSSAKMIVRVVMSPEHAKGFFNIFKENLDLYESIKDKGTPVADKVPVKE